MRMSVHVCVSVCVLGAQAVPLTILGATHLNIWMKKAHLSLLAVTKMLLGAAGTAQWLRMLAAQALRSEFGSQHAHN